MPIAAELLEPLAGDSPTGVSLRYEPVYDQIKQARIEEADVPQGEWRHERKTADFALVVKLATEALSKRSKDLQLAAWLTEAKLKREGFGGLAEGLDLLRELIERFWEGLYPEIDEGDLEFRVAPLEWVGQYLDDAVRTVPLTEGEPYDVGLYKQSRLIGYEADADGEYEKLQARKKSLEEGKLSAEQFDAAFDSTPKAFYKKLLAGIDAARTSLDALEALTDERFGNVAPSFGKLRDALTDVRQVAGQLLARRLETDPDPIEETLAAEEAAVAGAGPSGDGAAGGAGGAAPAGAVTGGVSAVPQSREDAIGRVAAAARYLRSASLADPAPYLLLRGLRWGELRAAAPLDPKLLVAPPTDVRARLKGLLLDGRWRELVEAGEEVMGQAYGRGWLDLQRYVLTACDALGAELDAVVRGVEGALRTLLRDLPELPGMTLMDDTPTANVETRKWLHERGLVGGSEPESEEPEVALNGRARGDPFERALERIRGGDPQRAVEMLLREADREKSERARFLRRTEAARVMVDAGYEPVALPILHELLEQVEKHTLEEWEAGDTVAQPLGLLYRCLVRLEPGSPDKDSLYLRICRLDPLQGMHLTTATETNEPVV